VVYRRSYSAEADGRTHLGEGFVLRCFQRLSNQTWLPSDAPGGTTGTPEVCPPRSSRTGGSPPQFSCAHRG